MEMRHDLCLILALYDRRDVCWSTWWADEMVESFNRSIFLHCVGCTSRLCSGFILNPRPAPAVEKQFDRDVVKRSATIRGFQFLCGGFFLGRTPLPMPILATCAAIVLTISPVL